MTDPGTVRRIAAAADVKPGDTVLEIGPGLGSLTLALLEAGFRVVAVEIDARLAAALPATVAAHGANPEALTVIHQDALEIQDAAELCATPGAAPPQALVANLPYNVATPLLLHFLQVLPGLEQAIVMVQAEVADRWVAGVGDGAYGAPSAKLAWWGQCQRAFRVGRAVFYPRPNVDSAVVEFSRREVRSHLEETGFSDYVRDADEAKIEQLRQETFAIITAAFGMRRKTLRQSLSGYAGSPDAAAALLEAAGIAPGLRGERLEIADFTRLAVAKINGTGGTK